MSQPVPRAQPETPPVVNAEARAVALLLVGSLAAAAQAGDVMTTGFVSCRPNDALPEVPAMMHKSGVIHVLVIGSDGKRLGAVNARDVLRALLAADNHEEALLRNYVIGMGHS